MTLVNINNLITARKLLTSAPLAIRHFIILDLFLRFSVQSLYRFDEQAQCKGVFPACECRNDISFKLASMN